MLSILDGTVCCLNIYFREENNRLGIAPLVEHRCQGLKISITSGKNFAKSPSERTRGTAERILRAAHELFLEHGYTATSMDSIAERAGVCKATVYSHHPSKEDLFSRIVRNLLDRHSPIIVEEQSHEKDVRRVLLRLGRAVVALALANDDVAAHRMVIAEAGRSPDLGELYYEAGPARLHLHLEHIMRRAMREGQLRRRDAKRAASHFVALVMGQLHLEALLCVRKTISHGSRESVIKSGVEVFYLAYGPIGKGPR